MRFKRFLVELRRRRLARVAALYTAAAVGTLQAADVVAGAFAWPGWVVPALVWASMGGLPLALVMGWGYDVSSRGLVRIEPLPEDADVEAPRRGWVPGLSGALLLAAVATLAASAFFSLRAARPAPVRSIAVLPLSNQMGDADGAYFVDGLHDALIASLAGVEGLTVISRTSVLRYRGTERPIPEIAAELGVEALVEGSVYRSGDSVAITLQLVRASPEEHLWARRYEGGVGEAIGLQRTVAASIAREIRLAVSAPPAGPEAMDPAAQEAYLRGRAHWRTRSPESLARAVDYLEEAVTLQPDFALAHAALADAYMVARGYGATSLSWEEAHVQARAAAGRALALDPDLPEGHAALGFVRLQAERDLPGAERSLRRAVELNPSFAQAHAWLSLALRGQGRADEAVEAARTARRLDPFAPVMIMNLGFALVGVGHCDEAMAQARATLELSPDYADAHALEWRCRALAGDEAGAVDEMQEALRLWRVDPAEVAAHRAAFEERGWNGALRHEIELFRRGVLPVRSEYLVAQRMALLHELDGAFEALWAARAANDPLLVFEMRTDPLLRPVRDDLRYLDLQARVAGPR